VDFSEEPLQARIMCDGIFKVLKEKNCQLRILYLAKLCLKNEGEIKTLQKKKLREFNACLTRIAKRVLQVEMKRC